jgi:hypothetical protein
LAARAFSALDSYVYGFGRQQLNMSAGSGASLEERTEAFRRAVPADEFPFLTEMVAHYALKGDDDDRTDFDFGLDLILDGLERVLESR